MAAGPPSAPTPRLSSLPIEEEEAYILPRHRKGKPKSKKGLLFGLLGCGGLLVLLCGGVAVLGIYKIVQSAKIPAWKSFTSLEGRFTADFPGTPKEGSTNSDGMILHRFVVELPGGEVAYMVMYNDLPPGAGAAGPQFLLEAVASKFGERVKSRKNIQINGHTGMELEWTKKEGGQTWFLTDRIYLVENRMYQVMVTTTRGKIDPVSTTRFLDSFRLSMPAR